MQNHITSYEVILASSSKRRHFLLNEMKIKYEILNPEIDEIFSKKLKKSSITDYLSIKKSEPFYKKLKKNQLLITCDTIVWYKNKALGKPLSQSEAVNMLKSLSNKMHKVYSSICLSTYEKQIVLNDETKVYFRKLKNSQIINYVKNHDVMDRAGAYGIQDYIGHIGIKRIEGSYNNVLGFPTCIFVEGLKKLNISL